VEQISNILRRKILFRARIRGFAAMAYIGVGMSRVKLGL
jgi:hypothetical protein